MIVFDLLCGDGGERFEAWFGSNRDYEAQLAKGLVECPHCRSSNVSKAPMAPRLPPKTASHGLAALAAAQVEILKRSHWVGDHFAKTARAMHSGEIEAASVHGIASQADARSLIEEGVPIAQLPLPVVPPNQIN